jgi:hypothetical protein
MRVGASAAVKVMSKRALLANQQGPFIARVRRAAALAVTDCSLPSASARADSAPRRFRCGSLLPAADSAPK